MQSGDSQKLARVLMVPPEVVSMVSVGMSRSGLGTRSRQAVIDSHTTIPPPYTWTANRTAATVTSFFMTTPLEKSRPDGTGSSYLCKPLDRVKRELQKCCYNPVDA